MTIGEILKAIEKFAGDLSVGPHAETIKGPAAELHAVLVQANTPAEGKSDTPEPAEATGA